MYSFGAARPAGTQLDGRLVTEVCCLNCNCLYSEIPVPAYTAGATSSPSISISTRMVDDGIVFALSFHTWSKFDCRVPYRATSCALSCSSSPIRRPNFLSSLFLRSISPNTYTSELQFPASCGHCPPTAIQPSFPVQIAFPGTSKAQRRSHSPSR